MLHGEMSKRGEGVSREETCCFTGHRPGKLPWKEEEWDPRCLRLKERLAAAVDGAYEKGMRHFICGMARGADLYFCEAVLDLRRRQPDVFLEAAVPCPQQASRWPKAQKERYDRLLAECDLVTLVQENYTPDCMMRRNRYMVERSGMIIAVYDGLPGGTMRTLTYALRQGLELVQLAPEE